MPRIPTIRDSDDCSISLWSGFCRGVGRERTEGGNHGRVGEGEMGADGIKKININNENGSLTQTKGLHYRAICDK